VGAITVKDVDESNVDDIFRVCSNGGLDNPLQMQGIELRRRWRLGMIRRLGTCAKVAYLDERPVAQLLFYPESAAPFIPKSREGVVLLRCVYNPFEEARGKGASTALVKSLLVDCAGSPKFLGGKRCAFVASEPFNTGEGVPMEKFYAASGFERRGDEMIYKVGGEYLPPAKPRWAPQKSDTEKAITLYNPTCEYSYVFATRTRDILRSIYPELQVDIVDQWEKPEVSMRLANHWLAVKGTRINSGFRDGESFTREVRQAVEGSS
jgi:hypothetical protein